MVAYPTYMSPGGMSSVGGTFGLPGGGATNSEWGRGLGANWTTAYGPPAGGTALPGAGTTDANGISVNSGAGMQAIVDLQNLARNAANPGQGGMAGVPGSWGTVGGGGGSGGGGSGRAWLPSAAQLGWGTKTYVPPSQDPYQLAAINAQAGILGDMYASDNQLAGTLGSSYNNMMGQLGAANAAANASMNNASKGLEGSNYAADKQLAGLGLSTGADRYQSDAQRAIAGTQADATKNVATQQAAMQLGLADKNNQTALALQNLQNDPTYAKLAMLEQSGLLGGLGGAGGAGGAGGTGGSANIAGMGAPVTNVMPFRGINDLMAGRMKGQAAGDIWSAENTAVNNLDRGLGNRGFSTNSPGAGALKQQMAMQAAGDVAQSNNKIDFGQYDTNAGNMQNYWNTLSNNQNAAAQRNLELQLLAQQQQGGLRNSLVAGLLG